MKTSLGVSRLLVFASVLGALALATGCSTLHLWGQKTGGNPANLGASLDVPLGKK